MRTSNGETVTAVGPADSATSGAGQRERCSRECRSTSVREIRIGARCCRCRSEPHGPRATGGRPRDHRDDARSLSLYGDIAKCRRMTTMGSVRSTARTRSRRCPGPAPAGTRLAAVVVAALAALAAGRRRLNPPTSDFLVASADNGVCSHRVIFACWISARTLIRRCRYRVCDANHAGAQNHITKGDTRTLDPACV